MFANPLIILIFILSCLTYGTTLAGSAADIKQTQIKITPHKVRFGKKTRVVIDTGQNPAGRQVFLSPGGPVRSRFLNALFQPETQIHNAVAHHNKVYVALTAGTKEHLALVDLEREKPRVVFFNMAQKSPVSETVKNLDNMFPATRSLYLTTNKQLVHRFSLPGMKQTASIVTPSRIIDIAETANKAYMLSENNDLFVYKLDTINNKVPDNHIKLNVKVNAIATDSRNVYLATPAGIFVLDPALDNIPDQPGFITSGTPRDIVIHQSLAYIADGEKGLAVVDISSPESMKLAGSLNKLGDTARLSIENKRLIISNDRHQLFNIDIKKPQKPVLLSIFTASKAVKQISLIRQQALVKQRDHFFTIDFKAETMPPVSTEGVTLGGSRRGEIRDNLMYVADWFSGLHIYDISDPASIKHLSNFNTKGSSKGVLLYKDYVFVGDDDHGLQIINIKNPEKPTWAAQIATTGLAYTMKRVGTLLYLADHRGGFHIYDISSIEKPRRLGGVDTPGKAWAIDVHMDFAYVADDQTGVLVFNIQHPANPILVGQFNPGGFAEDIKIIGNLAYVSFFDKGLYILDISKPEEPVALSHLPIPGNARGIEIHGDYAYIAAWYSGVQIVNITDKIHPFIIGHYDTDGATWGTVKHNNTIFALDWWDGIKSINIEDPARPTRISQYQAKHTISDLALKKGYLFTSNRQSGLQVHDVRNPLNPMWVTGLDIPGDAQGIKLLGDHALIRTERDITVVNIENPFSVYMTSRLTMQNNILDMQTLDDQLYVLDASNFLTVSNINASGKLEKNTPMELTGCHQFFINHNTLACSGDSNSLSIYHKEASSGNFSFATDIKLDHQPDLLYLTKKRIFIYSRKNRLLTVLKNSRPFAIQSTHKTTHDITHLQVIDNKLYTSNRNEHYLKTYLLGDRSLTDSTVYTSTHPISAFVKKDNQLFFAGEKRLSSLSLLPALDVAVIESGKLTINLPAGMPLGMYNLHILGDNTVQSVYPNSLTVEFPRFRLPQFK